MAYRVLETYTIHSDRVFRGQREVSEIKNCVGGVFDTLEAAETYARLAKIQAANWGYDATYKVVQRNGRPLA